MASAMRNQKAQQQGWNGVSENLSTTVLNAFESGLSDRGSALRLVAYEGSEKILDVNLSSFHKEIITFGAAADNDIVIPSRSGIVSRRHGNLMVRGQYCTMNDAGSTNGLMVNGVRQASCSVQPGDIIAIGKPGRHNAIILLLSYVSDRWDQVDLSQQVRLQIGRDPSCNLVLPVSSVSSRHALLQRDLNTGAWYICDCQSFNGTYQNGRRVGAVPEIMTPGSCFYVSSVPIIFLGELLLIARRRDGVDLRSQSLFMERRQNGTRRLTSQDISLHIRPGEFVAIIGGSGSGKSTLLNELNGTDPATSGAVYVNGTDLYANYNTLKNTIGYVPQQDIVYDNLSVFDVLNYAAELRMPPDTSKQDREKRVEEVLNVLELTGERKNFVGNLSGGQKKRASIAVELLADPRLLFLDEPTSGLDPGMEKNLMHKLAEMAHEGRTIVLVTHTVANIDLCDRVVIMGPGGKLCYEGDPMRALAFFGVSEYSEIYPKIDKEVDYWQSAFAQYRQRTASDSALLGNVPMQAGQPEVKEKVPRSSQFATLTKRYAHLTINDRARLLLLLLQAPILAALICLVTGSDCFKIYEDTKSCLFALSCAAFWVGMLNSIQEICKERDIYQREYASGMSVSAYVASKVVVLGVICLIQSLLLVVVFCVITGVPSYASGVSALINPALEMFVTVLLTALSAMCLGLFISALFRNPDRAIAMAPILIMPQILFSGLIFELKGVAEYISLFVNCRWSMEGLGTTANLNALDNAIVGEEIDLSGVELHDIEAETPATTVTQTVDTALGSQEVTVDVPADTTTIDTVTIPDGTTQTITSDMFPHDPEDAFTFTLAHLATDWGILFVFCVVCIGLCYGLLKVRGRK